MRVRFAAAALVAAMFVAGCGSQQLHPAALGTGTPTGKSTPSVFHSLPKVTTPVSRLSTSTTASPTASGAPEPGCTGSELRPSLGGFGDAAGAKHVQFLLTNTGASACTLEGVPGLEGISGSGSATRLVFPGDPGTAFPGPVKPGIIAPGQTGAVWVTMDNNCGPNASGYARLSLVLGGRRTAAMPYPQPMTQGCLDAVSPAGPIPPPS